MEVLDHIYDQFFFTANISGQQPATAQYIQPLAPQTVALAAAAIQCLLSHYDSRKKATALFSQDEYHGTLYPSPVINFTLAATTLINHKLVGRLTHPPLVQLHLDRQSIVPVSAPLFHSELYTPLCMLLSLGWDILNSRWHFSVWIVVSILHTTFITAPPPLQCFSIWIGTPLFNRHFIPHRLALFNPPQHSIP